MNYSRKSYILLGDAISLVVSFFVMIALGFPGLDKEEVINLHQGPFIIISILWLIVFFVFKFLLGTVFCFWGQISFNFFGIF